MHVLRRAPAEYLHRCCIQLACSHFTHLLLRRRSHAQRVPLGMVEDCQNQEGPAHDKLLVQRESNDAMCCRYIDAPMADVARPGNEAPTLAPHMPLEERAAAARQRHALHHAQGALLFDDSSSSWQYRHPLATWQ